MILKLVENSFAKTSSPNDRSWKLAGDHLNLCRLEQTDGHPDQQVRDWLAAILDEKSLEEVAKRINSCKTSVPSFNVG